MVAVVGAFRPRLFIADHVFESLTAEELAATIAHEYGHLAAHDNFKRVVKGEFDVAELAIMTYLQAMSWGRPLVALPVVLHGRFQHGQLAYNADRGALAPADLAGKRIGMRTYSQTTPTWVRGVLQNDFGVDLAKVRFVTFDDGHVPDYRDPPNAEITKPVTTAQ